MSRQTLLRRAAEMRRNPTEPEQRLWNAIRHSRLSGYKFRRQAIIGDRIVDFICPAKALVVEADGDTHDHEVDRARDERLIRSTGCRVARFTNTDVMHNLEGVLAEVRNLLETRTNRWPGYGRHHPPAPSSEEEGEI